MIPILENWSFGFLDDKKFPMPITGDVRGHNYFNDRENIQTSPIIDVFLIKGQVSVKTKNHSTYILDKPTEEFKVYCNIVKNSPQTYMSPITDEMNFDSNKNTVIFLRWFLSLD